MAEEKDQKLDKGLLAEACKAYGIDPKYVLNSRQEEDGTLVIVTNGGKKVRFKSGDRVESLDPIAVTGINPVKRKPITGPGAKK